jgi:5-methylcytosine-specific restriction endonuclease McrA
MMEHMQRFWISPWRHRLWRPDVNDAFVPLRTSASNRYRQRGVSAGDVVYVVSIANGQLYLGGRIAVAKIVSRAQAIRLFASQNLYDADEWIIAPQGGGTQLHLYRRLEPALSKRLRFVSGDGEPKGLAFVSASALDNQSIRGVRELTRESAELFDQIIYATDSLPHTSDLLTVTEAWLRAQTSGRNDEAPSLPEEVRRNATFHEGNVDQILVNRYERDRRARNACIAHHGPSCFICGFSFLESYGEAFRGFIHVHHLIPLASLGRDYELDPVRDLRPICPNCHAIVHRRDPPYSPEEVQGFLG